MRRVLVYSPDLMFFSQIKGSVEPLGWTAQRIPDDALPPDGISGDTIVVDCNRDLPRAYRVLDKVRPECPWLVLACYQHLHAEVAEEAVRRGATEAVRRGAILSRLVARLSEPAPSPSPAIYGGDPLDPPTR